MGRVASPHCGTDALATTRVTVAPNFDSGVAGATSLHSQTGGEATRKFSGAGSDGDIVVASARAYVAALNKMIKWSKSRRGSVDEEEKMDRVPVDPGGVGKVSTVNGAE